MERLDVRVGVADFEGVVLAVGLGLGTNWQQAGRLKVQAKSSRSPSILTAVQSCPR